MSPSCWAFTGRVSNLIRLQTLFPIWCYDPCLQHGMLAQNHRSWIHPCSSCLDRTSLCRAKVRGQHLQSVFFIQHSQREVIRSNQRPRASFGSNCRVQFSLSGAAWLSHQAIIKTRPRVRQGLRDGIKRSGVISAAAYYRNLGGLSKDTPPPLLTRTNTRKQKSAQKDRSTSSCFSLSSGSRGGHCNLWTQNFVAMSQT